MLCHITPLPVNKLGNEIGEVFRPINAHDVLTLWTELLIPERNSVEEVYVMEG